MTTGIWFYSAVFEIQVLGTTYKTLGTNFFPSKAMLIVEIVVLFAFFGLSVAEMEKMAKSLELELFAPKVVNS